MSYLDKLLQGVEVEWKTLGEVADYEQPAKYIVKSNNYSDKFKNPFNGGKKFYSRIY
jgi:type I restriction enzyme S subunit